jgi:tetratricopeptide (TPR) repeat protein
MDVKDIFNENHPMIGKMNSIISHSQYFNNNQTPKPSHHGSLSLGNIEPLMQTPLNKDYSKEEGSGMGKRMNIDSAISPLEYGHSSPVDLTPSLNMKSTNKAQIVNAPHKQNKGHHLIPSSTSSSFKFQSSDHSIQESNIHTTQPMVQPFRIDTPAVSGIGGGNLGMSGRSGSVAGSGGRRDTAGKGENDQVSITDFNLQFPSELQTNKNTINTSTKSQMHNQQSLHNAQNVEALRHSMGFGYRGGGGKAHGRNDIKDIVSLLKQLGIAYQNLCTFKCEEAIREFKKLPKNQYFTGWVLSMIGKSNFENFKYSEAEKYFNDSIRFEPYRLEGLEYYSTCLWHLKKQVELCWLANFALEKSLFAPETWCVVGNCYSLQKEHETALKFFNRAIQLNGNFAYAHTLCGHEYVANEDFETAKKCYQRALSADDRHYNAWWGLGNIYLKQEKYDQSIAYFKRALQINSQSSVLMTYLGMAHNNNKQVTQALACFEKAEKMDPHNPLNKYQKANVLMVLNKLHEALKVLENLSINVPREAPIHIMIGKINKKLGDKDKALSHFNIAMDLDPKDSNMVKSLIDKIDKDNDFNDDSDP